jgi:RNA polymerase sigma factor (sigma-70 family)
MYPVNGVNELEVRAAARGDREAFAALYARWSSPVLAFLVGRLGRREDAEDALQAAFLDAWRNLPRLRRPSRFVRWLFRIARSRAADLDRRRRLGLVALGAEEGEPAAPAPEEDADSDRVRMIVKGLRPRTRTVLLLRTVKGMSAEEVGQALGLSASTIRREHARALEHLRVALEKSHERERRAARA